MAQRILQLAAEESPERLQEALQGLAEGEVPGGEGAPPALSGGRGAASALKSGSQRGLLFQLGDMVTRQALRGRETAALLRGIFRGG